jgi:hypothetical protein
VRPHDEFGPDAHRYLDGEPHGELRPDDQVRADRLAAALRAYCARLPVPGAEVDDAVMAAVRVRSPERRAPGWRWLVEPRVVRIRPVWVPVLAAAAAVVFWLGPRAWTPGAPERPPIAAAARDTVYVRFELVAAGARTVAVAGSFNDWRPEALPLARREGGAWSITVPLPIGEHEYQFVLDGERWVPDPTAQAHADDGFGGTNSVIVVGPKGVVRS